ncbi:MAG: hypothetical protein JNN18_02160 [Rubrivivax sp.]|nr:hypothetical protein [Rubrivivax sp.]
MAWAVAATLVAAVPARAAGTDGDPLRAPACREALAALERAEREAPAPPAEGASGAMPAALTAARRQAAQVCLAGPPDPPRPAQPSMRPPIAVPLATVAPARPPPSVPGPTMAVPAPRAPVTITACDTTGCWASDGTRLQRAGPQLLGPRGLCSTAGALLNCP